MKSKADIVSESIHGHYGSTPCTPSTPPASGLDGCFKDKQVSLLKLLILCLSRIAVTVGIRITYEPCQKTALWAPP